MAEVDKWTGGHRFWGMPRHTPRLENIGIKITVSKCMVLLYPIIATIVHGFIYSSNGCDILLGRVFT